MGRNTKGSVVAGSERQRMSMPLRGSPMGGGGEGGGGGGLLKGGGGGGIHNDEHWY